MRIALLTEIPAPFRIPLFNALAAREGVELDVVFLAESQPGRPYRLHEEELRFAWRVLPGTTRIVRGRWLALNRGVPATVRRADLVVVGGWNQPAFWQAAAAAAILRRPLAVWVESTLRDARRGSALAERAKRTLVGLADAVLVPGSAAAEYAEALGARRVVRAPNAVDAALFRDRVEQLRADRDAIRAELGVEDCCFLAVGRLAPEKGFDTLLAAAEAVEGAAFLLAGAGPEEARLREAAPPSVRFLGEVDRDELPRLYAAADAVVVPSRSETWGMVLSEAAAAGLPIVASEAAGAAWELVEQGVSGFRVPPGDAEALAEALRRVAADPGFRTRAGARSRELAAPLTAESWADAVAALALRLHRGAHGGQ